MTGRSPRKDPLDSLGKDADAFQRTGKAIYSDLSLYPAILLQLGAAGTHELAPWPCIFPALLHVFVASLIAVAGVRWLVDDPSRVQRL